jgi:DNA-directed RNA polymerase subunit RPC12/RpoP
MEQQGALRAATLTDKQDYLAGGLQPVDCRSCGTRVLVKKNSPQHTSIQWTSDSARSCPEVAARVAAGENAARVEGCGKLRDSIEQAVWEGRLEVSNPDG